MKNTARKREAGKGELFGRCRQPRRSCTSFSGPLPLATKGLKARNPTAQGDGRSDAALGLRVSPKRWPALKGRHAGQRLQDLLAGAARPPKSQSFSRGGPLQIGYWNVHWTPSQTRSIQQGLGRP